jgi:hypothetical protein
MHKRVCSLLCLLCLLCLIVAIPSVAAYGQASRALIDQYCVGCHNERLKTAGLMLDKLDVSQIGGNPAAWEKVARKLRAGDMPPAGRPRPARADAEAFAASLEAALDAAAAAQPNPGAPAIHRLNRTEYSNAIRDLLALDTSAVDVKSWIPADDSGYGFDNIGDVLSLSPLLLEKYLSAAEKISRLAVGDPKIPPADETYDAPKGLVQDDRTSDELPFGSRGGLAVHHYFPLDGEYLIQVRLQRTSGQERETILGLQEQRQIDVRLDGHRLKLFVVGGGQSQLDLVADGNLELRFPAKAGSHIVAVSFIKDTVKPAPRRNNSGAISSVTIRGPYNATGSGETASRARIFACRPAPGIDNENACAANVLGTLARRAYRRPVAKADLAPLLDLYKDGRKDGGFEAGIEMALRGILVSPGFLFRIERDPPKIVPGAAYRISDTELASRLSFFLWSSIPDDALLDAAEQGKLRDPAVLEQQVRRMLADSRSSALVQNFAGQWLYLRNLQSVLPDPSEFPDFDDNLRQAMQQETELFFASMLREDRSVLDLLTADYTFVNERLARHYQIPNVFGNGFRRVAVSNEARRGLLGQASVLTVTSYATRTSPTLRGKWLLENILGTPPPPPPDNVPSLKDDTQSKAMSMRERMEQHRANVVCASCHARMDPMGFALENFDAIGRWRTRNSDGSPVDASGVLPDGSKVEGPAGLRAVLLQQPDQFAGNLTDRLLTYALGRGTEYYDAPVIRAVTREAARNGYRWSSLILGIVRSTPFQMRKSVGP